MDSVMSWDFPGRLAGCVFISSEHQQYKILDTFHFLGWTEAVYERHELIELRFIGKGPRFQETCTLEVCH